MANARGADYSLTAAERETTIVAVDDDPLVRIFTCQRKYITRLRKDERFTEVGSGFYGTTEWANFTIPADRWSPAGAKRSVSLTREQREALAARLAANRHQEESAE